MKKQLSNSILNLGGVFDESNKRLHSTMPNLRRHQPDSGKSDGGDGQMRKMPSGASNR
jgi:hypothetical protein